MPKPVIVPLIPELAERVKYKNKTNSLVGIFSYLQAKDVFSNKDFSLQLSDLTKFLVEHKKELIEELSPPLPSPPSTHSIQAEASSSSTPPSEESVLSEGIAARPARFATRSTGLDQEFAKSQAEVQANYRDLDNFNANELIGLLNAFTRLYYLEIQTCPANNLLRKEAIQALAIKTIEKFIEEDRQQDKDLQDTIRQINLVINTLKPEQYFDPERRRAEIPEKYSLLQGFSDYVAPNKKKIQDVMIEFLYPVPEKIIVKDTNTDQQQEVFDLAKCKQDFKKLTDPKVMWSLRELCCSKIGVGSSDIEAYRDLLKANRLILQKELEILNREDLDDLDRKAAIRKIREENFRSKGSQEEHAASSIDTPQEVVAKKLIKEKLDEALSQPDPVEQVRRIMAVINEFESPEITQLSELDPSKFVHEIELAVPGFIYNADKHDDKDKLQADLIGQLRSNQSKLEDRIEDTKFKLESNLIQVRLFLRLFNSNPKGKEQARELGELGEDDSAEELAPLKRIKYAPVVTATDKLAEREVDYKQRLELKEAELQKLMPRSLELKQIQKGDNDPEILKLMQEKAKIYQHKLALERCKEECEKIENDYIEKYQKSFKHTPEELIKDKKFRIVTQSQLNSWLQAVSQDNKHSWIETIEDSFFNAAKKHPEYQDIFDINKEKLVSLIRDIREDYRIKQQDGIDNYKSITSLSENMEKEIIADREKLSSYEQRISERRKDLAPNIKALEQQRLASIATLDAQIEENKRTIASLKDEIAAVQKQQKTAQRKTEKINQRLELLQAETQRYVGKIRENSFSFLSQKEFEEYLKAVREAVNKHDDLNQSVILLKASGSRIYDVIIDLAKEQCIVVLPGKRGTDTELLLKGKGNFGDIGFGIDLLTNKWYVIKKENTAFIVTKVISKLGVAGGCANDSQNEEERNREWIITWLTDLARSRYRGPLATDTQEKFLEETLKYVVHSKSHAKEELKANLIPNPQVPEDPKFEEILTVLESLKGKDWKDQILELNEKFIIAMLSGYKSTGVEQDFPGASEFYKYLHTLEYFDVPTKQQLLQEDVKKRFKMAMGFLEKLSELHNDNNDPNKECILHGDIKPKNYMDNRTLDYGTSWIERQANEDGKGTMDSRKTGTAEFMPPEYVFKISYNNASASDDELIIKERKDYNVKITREGDIYQAGVSLFGYTDLATYRQAFTLHNPGQPFPYDLQQNYGNLIQQIDGRDYIRIYDYPKAEASGLELLEALKAVKDLSLEFGELYQRLVNVRDKMCHYDPKKRYNTMQEALIELTTINDLYLDLLSNKPVADSLVQQLAAVEAAQTSAQKMSILETTVALPTNSVTNLLSAVVTQYSPNRPVNLEKVMDGVKETDQIRILGLSTFYNKSPDYSPLLLSVKTVEQIEIFKALFKPLSPKTVIEFLTKENKNININRDLVHLAAQNNNFIVIEEVFAKLNARLIELKQQLESTSASAASSSLSSLSTQETENICRAEIRRIAKIKAELILEKPSNISKFIKYDGDNLLAWAAYYKDLKRLEFLAKELKDSFAYLGLVDERQLNLALQFNSSKIEQTGGTEVSADNPESIFHLIAHNKAIPQLVVLCNVFYNNDQNAPWKKLADLPLEVLAKLGEQDWACKTQGLAGDTPLGLLFKEPEFVKNVFAKLKLDIPEEQDNPAGQSEKERLNQLLINPNNSRLSPIQIGFAVNDNIIIEEIVKKANFALFDLKDNDGKNVLHYLVGKSNGILLEKLMNLLTDGEIEDLEQKKIAFVNALIARDNNRQTPLTLLASAARSDKDFVARDQAIFLKLIDFLEKNKELLVISLTTEDFITDKVLNFNQEVLYDAVVNKKYEIIPSIIKYVTAKEDGLMDLVTGLQYQPSSSSANDLHSSSFMDGGKNFFHHLFANQEENQGIIAFAAIKAALQFTDHDEQLEDKQQQLQKIIAMFGETDNRGETPLSIAIKDDMYRKTVVDFLTQEQFKAKAFSSEKLYDMLLTQCGEYHSCLLYLSNSDNPRYLTEVLFPILNALSKEDKKNILKKIEEEIIPRLAEGTNRAMLLEYIAIYALEESNNQRMTEIRQKLEEINKEASKKISEIQTWRIKTDLIDRDIPNYCREISSNLLYIQQQQQYISKDLSDLDLSSITEYQLANQKLVELNDLLKARVHAILTEYREVQKKILADIKAKNGYYQHFIYWGVMTEIEDINDKCRIAQVARREFEELHFDPINNNKEESVKIIEKIQIIHAELQEAYRKHSSIKEIVDDPVNKLQVNIDRLTVLAIDFKKLELIGKQQIDTVCDKIKLYIEEYQEFSVDGKELELYNKIIEFLNPEFLEKNLSILTLPKQKFLASLQQQNKKEFNVAEIDDRVCKKIEKIEDALKLLKKENLLSDLEKIALNIQKNTEDKELEQINEGFKNLRARVEELKDKIHPLSIEDLDSIKGDPAELLSELKVIVQSAYNLVLDSRIKDKSKLFNLSSSKSEYKNLQNKVLEFYKELYTQNSPFRAHLELDQKILQNIREYEEFFLEESSKKIDLTIAGNQSLSQYMLSKAMNFTEILQQSKMGLNILRKEVEQEVFTRIDKKLKEVNKKQLEGERNANDRVVDQLVYLQEVKKIDEYIKSKKPVIEEYRTQFKKNIEPEILKLEIDLGIKNEKLSQKKHEELNRINSIGLYALLVAIIKGPKIIKGESQFDMVFNAIKTYQDKGLSAKQLRRVAKRVGLSIEAEAMQHLLEVNNSNDVNKEVKQVINKMLDEAVKLAKEKRMLFLPGDSIKSGEIKSEFFPRGAETRSQLDEKETLKQIPGDTRRLEKISLWNDTLEFRPRSPSTNKPGKQVEATVDSSVQSFNELVQKITTSIAGIELRLQELSNSFSNFEDIVKVTNLLVELTSFMQYLNRQLVDNKAPQDSKQFAKQKEQLENINQRFKEAILAINEVAVEFIEGKKLDDMTKVAAKLDKMTEVAAKLDKMTEVAVKLKEVAQTVYKQEKFDFNQITLSDVVVQIAIDIMQQKQTELELEVERKKQESKEALVKHLQMHHELREEIVKKRGPKQLYESLRNLEKQDRRGSQSITDIVDENQRQHIEPFKGFTHVQSERLAELQREYNKLIQIHGIYTDIVKAAPGMCTIADQKLEYVKSNAMFKV